MKKLFYFVEKRMLYAETKKTAKKKQNQIKQIIKIKATCKEIKINASRLL